MKPMQATQFGEGLEPLIWGIQIIAYSVRMTIYVTKRTVYAVGFFAPRVGRQIAHDMGLLLAIYQGKNIIVLGDTKADKVNNYHTRYDHSTRGNQNEAEWEFDNVQVKVGA